jgi:hypothetical protein
MSMFPPSFDVSFGVPSLAVGFAFYFLPAIIAWVRAHYNRVAILALNLLLGWTVVGWVVSLVWSFTNPPPRPDESGQSS